MPARSRTCIMIEAPFKVCLSNPETIEAACDVRALKMQTRTAGL